jgi:exodeoxyribonuclease V beta subunit
LDWKSNLLPSYDRDSVLRSMEAHQYDLQWKLYSIALDRWLKVRLPGYDPSAHFGGVHYLYLRGSSPALFSGFSERPTVRQLREDFPAEIAQLLGAAAGEAR